MFNFLMIFLDMTSTGQVYMCIAIIKGNSKTFSCLLKCDRTWKMEEILNNLVIENSVVMCDVLEDYPEVFIGCKTDSSTFNICNMRKIKLQTVLDETLEFDPNFKYIAFKYDYKRKMTTGLIESGDGSKKTKINAFAFMMIKTNDRVHLPSRIIDPKNGKNKLHNYVVDYMTRFHELRFSKQELSMQTLLLETLQNTLWMIDGLKKTL